MSVIFLLLILSFSIALLFLIIFLRAVKRGEFDDLDAPPLRLLMKEKKKTY
jgi:cbb3-type cytochrome oxidase maturation protein